MELGGIVEQNLNNCFLIKYSWLNPRSLQSECDVKACDAKAWDAKAYDAKACVLLIAILPSDGMLNLAASFLLFDKSRLTHLHSSSLHHNKAFTYALILDLLSCSHIHIVLPKWCRNTLSHLFSVKRGLNIVSVRRAGIRNTWNLLILLNTIWKTNLCF